MSGICCYQLMRSHICHNNKGACDDVVEGSSSVLLCFFDVYGISMYKNSKYKHDNLLKANKYKNDKVYI